MELQAFLSESPQFITSSLFLQALVLIVSSILALKSFRKKEVNEAIEVEHIEDGQKTLKNALVDSNMENIEKETEGDNIYKEIVQQENEEEKMSIFREKIEVIGDIFNWPSQAPILENSTKKSLKVSSDLKEKLEILGIYRNTDKNDKPSNVESAARNCGRDLTKKQVRVIFDTFLAKSRPGLETESGEEKEENSGDEATLRKGKSKGKGKRKSFVKF